MTQPVVAATVPKVMTLEAGTYYWCSCGSSKNQPFCDGSHKGTEFSPQAFTLEAAGQVALCQCKATGNVPFCDGSHSKLA
ncbi:MAG: CDGSH iron-sulfur domain-containing protein [Cyanobacteriota bacterium]|nr:CDGSH iron-sulfur domain-containing protein [Cyanobacteriota bacterium]